MGANSRALRSTLVMRWVARGLGTLVAAAWLFVLVGSIFEPSEPESLEGAMFEGAILSVLALVAIAGVALAWWRELLGGTILVADGWGLVVFALLTAGRNRGLAVLSSGAPFFVAGLLFLIVTEMDER